LLVDRIQLSVVTPDKVGIGVCSQHSADRIRSASRAVQDLWTRGSGAIVATFINADQSRFDEMRQDGKVHDRAALIDHMAKRAAANH
jgi:hypothetical protein